MIRPRIFSTPVLIELGCLAVTVAIVFNLRLIASIQALRLSRGIDGVTIAFSVTLAVGLIGLAMRCEDRTARLIRNALFVLAFLFGLLGPPIFVPPREFAAVRQGLFVSSAVLRDCDYRCVLLARRYGWRRVSLLALDAILL
jgi:hypothetical protein